MCLLPFQFFVSHNLSSWYNVYFWTFSCSFVYNDSSSVPKKSVNNVAFFVLRMNLLWQHLLLPRHFNYQDNAMTIFHHFKASVEKGKLIVMKRLLIWNHKYEIATNDIKLQPFSQPQRLVIWNWKSWNQFHFEAPIKYNKPWMRFFFGIDIIYKVFL